MPVRMNSYFRWYRILPVLAILLLLPQDATALTFPEKPPDEDFFVDSVGLIKEEDKSTLNEITKKLLAEENIPIYVVTIASLAGQDAAGFPIERYATELFNHWGIGFEDRNNGMLLLISSGDRKARIELGADWGREYDHQAKQIMDDLIIPNFRRGDFSTGILDGVRGLEAMARGLELPKPTQPWWILPLFIVGVIGIGILIYNLFKTGKSGWAWALIAFLGIAIFFMLRAAASRGGSGGGFGGGFSGGGGATGSW